jgi:hypothetical protein
MSQIGQTATETFEMLKLSFREKIVSRTQAFYWLTNYKSGVTSGELCRKFRMSVDE